MALRRIDGHWHIDIRHNGRRIRRSTGLRLGQAESKRKAQELHDKIKHDLWSQAHLGTRPAHTWKQAVVKWIQENSQKKSLKDDKQRLRILDQWLADKQLSEIDKELVDKIKQERKLQRRTHYAGKNRARAVSRNTVSVAEVNRCLALLRSILNAAVEWDWIDKAPKVKLFKEPKGRVRWLKPEEATRLLGQLAPHLRAMAAFTLETGLRDQNVTKLKWSEVDMASQIATVNAKGDNLLSVPLNSNAVMILRQQLFQHPEYVFVLNGRPVDRPNNSGWKAALERAGIEDFRWHDLRHTWASWHVQCGTDLYTLKELGGWEEISMVMRYAHLAPKNLAAAQEMVESRAGFGQDAIHRGTGEHA